MGRLTTFTIRGDDIDGLGRILEGSEAFCRKLREAESKPGIRRIEHGGYYNLVKVQPTRHPGEDTLYVQMGNSIYEMSTRLLEKTPETSSKGCWAT